MRRLLVIMIVLACSPAPHAEEPQVRREVPPDAGSSCRAACEATADVCPQYQIDVDVCTEQCIDAKSIVDGVAELDTACVASAATCADVEACSADVQ